MKKIILFFVFMLNTISFGTQETIEFFRREISTEIEQSMSVEVEKNEEKHFQNKERKTLFMIKNIEMSQENLLIEEREKALWITISGSNGINLKGEISIGEYSAIEYNYKADYKKDEIEYMKKTIHEDGELYNYYKEDKTLSDRTVQRFSCVDSEKKIGEYYFLKKESKILQHNRENSYYSDEFNEEKGNYIANIKSGEWVVRNKESRTDGGGFYKNGIKVGLWITYDDSSVMYDHPVKAESTYYNGILHGPYKNYYSDNLLYHNYIYIYGLLHGLQERIIRRSDSDPDHVMETYDAGELIDRRY